LIKQIKILDYTHALRDDAETKNTYV